MVHNRGGVVAWNGRWGDEAPVEGRAGEEVHSELKVGIGRDLTALAGPVEDEPDGFTPAFGEPAVQALQGWIAFSCVNEGCHQLGKGLIGDQGLERREQLDQVGAQLSGRRQGERLVGILWSLTSRLMSDLVAEDTVCLEAAFRRGLESAGVPRAVFDERCSAFVSAPFHRTLATLGIRIGHSRPGYPASRGKIERFSPPSAASSW